MNDIAKGFNTRLAFSVDESTGKRIIKVVDMETEEVVRQIPLKETLRLMGKMREVIGTLLDIKL